MYCLSDERACFVTADIVIVGAGLAGLMAARVLQDRGFNVTVLDKGRSVGGRLATRRIGEGLADHGAQFFTVRNERFREYAEQWLAEGLIYPWSNGWSDGSLKRTHRDGHPRYAVRGGMNQLARHIAASLRDVHVETQVSALEPQVDSWLVRTPAGLVIEARALLLTPPAPQSLELLEASGVQLSEADRDELERIAFGPCLCGLFLVQGGTTLPEPGALQDFDRPIYWLADNKRKGISQETVVTVHASITYSRQRWDDEDAAILADLRASVEEYLDAGAQIVEEQLKRWRYSLPLTTHPEYYLLARGLPTLAFAGDAFGGRGRVEGAALSGLRVADMLADILGS